MHEHLNRKNKERKSIVHSFWMQCGFICNFAQIPAKGGNGSFFTKM